MACIAEGAEVAAVKTTVLPDGVNGEFTLIVEVPQEQ
jgi:hypothetical protein